MTKGKFRPVLFSVLVLMHVMMVYALWYAFAHFYWNPQATIQVLWNFSFWHFSSSWGSLRDVFHPGFSIEAWVWFFGLHTLRQVGISLGYHRLLTHLAFKCHFGTKLVLSFLAGLAVQGTILAWILDHMQHHWDTEGPLDPHSPYRYPGWRGFLWAHIAWMCFDVKRPNENFGMIFKENNVRLLKWNRWIYPVAALSGFILPFYFAGMDGLLLGGFLGVLLHLHLTWSVNSICHLYGSIDKRFKAPGNARNNPVVCAAPSVIGEGYHFYHHAKADSAFLGWKWYHLDLGKWILCAGEPLGIFWDIKRPRAGA